MTNALEVIGLSKRFLLAHGARASNSKEIWALDDVTFSLAHGTCLGLVGSNGAGKSTLLKILSRITAPTAGTARIRGRVASLLEVGTGFHPELSGRENIFLNGAILGMSRKAVARQLDAIAAFAEVEAFLSLPVKHYSTGMYLKLAFSVAAHLDPDILMVDEVLAVGDAAFQRKCLSKMDSASKEGRTILFVSHNLQAIKLLCNRAILISGGQLFLDGSPQDVIDAYTSNLDDSQVKNSDEAHVYQSECSSQKALIRLGSGRGLKPGRFSALDPVTIDIAFTDAAELLTTSVEILIWAADQTLLVAQGSPVMTSPLQGAKAHVLRLTIPSPFFNAGHYEFGVRIKGPHYSGATQRSMYFDILDPGCFLSAVSKAPRGGFLGIPLSWKIERLDS